MTTLEEYDLEFKLVTIVRCQGLCKIAFEALDLVELLEEG